MSAADSRHDMGDAWGRNNAGSGGNKVGDDLHGKTTGNHGIVGGVVTNI